MVKSDFDVIIVGAGIVGAALACALRDSGLNLALVEPHPVAPPTEEWDTRIYALSPGSASLLANIGVWETLDQRRICPVFTMDVRGDQGAKIVLDAYQAGVSQLAWILEGNRIQYGLWQAMKNQANLTLISGAKGENLCWSETSSSSRRAKLSLDDGRKLSADLVVAADGRSSWVRAQAGIEARREDYQQSGVVANFACEHPHRNIARQWFREDGVLAWLPLPDNIISMVWSTDQAHTQALLAATPEQLAEWVAQAGDNSLGKLRTLTSAAAFPLSILRVSPIVAPGLALVGDAAHGVHPLSGQGVNLGLRDVAELARILKQRGAAPCGDLALLQHYARARRGDIVTTQSLTDGLHQLFRHQNPVLRHLRNAGMDVAGRVGPLNSWLVQQSLV
jgi:ubiquinone biosynthesis UbiH/UbiF/VisC/COQ6 family hydroxylase